MQPRTIDVLAWSPRVFRIPSVMTPEECDALIELARPQMKASVAIDTTVENKRTSFGTFFRGPQVDLPLVRTIRERVGALVLQPPDHAEPMQVLRYEAGQEYKPHVDYIPPKSARAPARLAKGGQRLVTVLLYLNEVEEGGGTAFPRIDLSVPARRGDAVGFYNVLPTHRVDRMSLHAGEPVVRGTKWVATLWFRERAYSPT